MNWEPSLIWQDSNDMTMSPDFSSTTQDTSWEPWIQTDELEFSNWRNIVLRLLYFSGFLSYLSAPLPTLILPPALWKRAHHSSLARPCVHYVVCFQRETWWCQMENGQDDTHLEIILLSVDKRYLPQPWQSRGQRPLRPYPLLQRWPHALWTSSWCPPPDLLPRKRGNDHQSVINLVKSARYSDRLCVRVSG